MLPFFNQKELVVCSNQSQYQKYTSLLEKKESDIEQKYAIYHRRLCFRWEPVKELEPHFKRSIIKCSTQYMFAKPITNALFTLSLFD